MVLTVYDAGREAEGPVSEGCTSKHQLRLQVRNTTFPPPPPLSPFSC